MTTLPYAVENQRHCQEINRLAAADMATEARRTLEALNLAILMEHGIEPDEPEDPADDEHWLPGIDDVPDHVREGWDR